MQTTAGGIEQIVLATGKARRSWLAGQSSALGYTRPRGLNILGWRQTASAQVRLARFGLTGKPAKVLASGNNDTSAVYDAAGDRLAVGGTKGVRLVSNGGGLIRSLPVSRHWRGGLHPVPGTILASCVACGKSAGRLWLVPASGARPKALTPQRGSHSRDLGDIGAWQLPSGLFLQAAGPCGALQIFRQAKNGSIAAVHTLQTKGNNNRILTARKAAADPGADRMPRHPVAAVVQPVHPPRQVPDQNAGHADRRAGRHSVRPAGQPFDTTGEVRQFAVAVGPPWRGNRGAG